MHTVVFPGVWFILCLVGIGTGLHTVCVYFRGVRAHTRPEGGERNISLILPVYGLSPICFCLFFIYFILCVFWLLPSGLGQQRGTSRGRRRAETCVHSLLPPGQGSPSHGASGPRRRRRAETCSGTAAPGQGSPSHGVPGPMEMIGRGDVIPPVSLPQ